MDKLKKILSFAMKLEKQGESFYTYYKDRVSNKDTQKLFEHLADIERDHYNYLKEKYDLVDNDKDLKDISWVVDSHNFIKHPSVFSNQSEQLSNINLEDEVSDLAIMRMAYSIENDFSEFYSLAASNSSTPDIKEFFEGLAKWEEGHRKLFYQQYKKLLKKNWADIEGFIFPNEDGN